MGRKSALVKYGELFDQSRDMPDWATKYARWLIGHGAWNERLTGMGRRKLSKAQHQAFVETCSGEMVPWTVLVELRKSKRFRDYGMRWLREGHIRRKDKMEDAVELAWDRTTERLSEAGTTVPVCDKDGKPTFRPDGTPITRFVVSNKELMAVASTVLNVGTPRKTEAGNQAPLIQINVTPAQAKAFIQAEEDAKKPPSEIPDVEWSIVEDEKP